MKAFSNVILKEFRHLRWIIIIGFISFLAIAILSVFAFDFLGGLVQQVPRELIEEIEIARSFMELFDDYDYYIWSQWNAKNLYQLGTLLVIIISASQFAGENSKKTMAFLLTRPVGRLKVFAGKISAGLLILLVIFATGTMCLWILSFIFAGNFAIARIFIASFLTFLWLALYYILGVMISILTEEPVPAGVITAVVGVILSIPGWFQSLRHFSIFYQMKAIDYFVFEIFPGWNIFVALVLTTVLFYVGYRIFLSRDY